MKLILTFTFILAICFTVSSQKNKDTALNSNPHTYTYAFLTIKIIGFSKKLQVDVDLGDTPEQEDTASVYSEILTSKKSYAAVLNYMSEQKYELVESRNDGAGGVYGIVFIMKKKIRGVSKI